MTLRHDLQSIGARTGAELWSHELVKPEIVGVPEDTSPTVYDGMVFVGASGGEDGVRGFIAAFNESTGTLLGEKRPGADLYSSSIIAIRASTDELLWYHQEVPHNVNRYGAEELVTLFNTSVGGKTVEAVAEAGKDGYLYILNAKNGHTLFPPVAVVKEDHSPPTREGTVECPGPIGAVDFSPLSFDPATADVYVGALEFCEDVTVTNCRLHGLRGEFEFCGIQRLPPGESRKARTPQ